MSATAEHVAQYAKQFHRALPDAAAGVPVSPFASWVQLALLAPAASDDERAFLTQLLGTDPYDAAGHAAEMLNRPHPALAASFAAWARTDHAAGTYESWAATLPPEVRTGEIPTADEMTRWVSETTGGLVPEETSLDQRTSAAMFGVLSACTKWVRPFTMRDASELGGAWAKQATHALEGPRAGVVETAYAGTCGAHIASARDGLDVISLVAAPDVPREAVLAAAHDLACDHETLHSAWVPVRDLEVEGGHAWDVTERTVRRPVGLPPTSRVEQSRAILPPWPPTGLAVTDIPDAAGGTVMRGAMRRALDLGDDATLVASQATVVDFDEADSTSPGAVHEELSEGEVLERTVTVRFGRPHAVVAVTRDVQWVDVGHGNFVAARGDVPAWECVPVVSAWCSLA